MCCTMDKTKKNIYQYEEESFQIQNWTERKEVSFNELVETVKTTSDMSQDSAIKAINRMLTMR